MKTIIAGSRDITDYAIVEKAVADSGIRITEVVSGCQKTRDPISKMIVGGVDWLGEQWASKNGVPVAYFPADWANLGLKAGPARNREMARYANALILIWDGKSKGSGSMLNFAIGRNLLIFEVLVLSDGTTRSRRHQSRKESV